jgi:glycosyltransferase involved in cell wall biosynthesis
VGGVPDLVEDGVTGLLVPDGDSTAPLAAAILRLAEDECTRATMGQAGRVRAERHFHPERATREVMQVYSAALAAKRRELAAQS